MIDKKTDLCKEAVVQVPGSGGNWQVEPGSLSCSPGSGCPTLPSTPPLPLVSPTLSALSSSSLASSWFSFSSCSSISPWSSSKTWLEKKQMNFLDSGTNYKHASGQLVGPSMINLESLLRVCASYSVLAHKRWLALSWTKKWSSTRWTSRSWWWPKRWLTRRPWWLWTIHNLYLL